VSEPVCIYISTFKDLNFGHGHVLTKPIVMQGFSIYHTRKCFLNLMLFKISIKS